MLTDTIKDFRVEEFGVPVHTYDEEEICLLTDFSSADLARILALEDGASLSCISEASGATILVTCKIHQSGIGQVL